MKPKITYAITSETAAHVGVVDYSEKLSAALAWLGDRHLLAEPQRRSAPKRKYPDFPSEYA